MKGKKRGGRACAPGEPEYAGSSSIPPSPAGGSDGGGKKKSCEVFPPSVKKREFVRKGRKTERKGTL